MRKWFRQWKQWPPAFYMMILLALLFSIQIDNYWSWNNLTNLLSQSAPLLVLACGQTLIVLMQGTDLSLGAMISWSCVLWIYLLNQGVSLPVSILLILISGICMGTLNGLLVAKGRMLIFIVTLGTQNIFKSAALLLSGNQTLYYEHDIFRRIAKSGPFSIPWSVWIAFLCFFFTMLLLRRTRFGMRLKGLGGNPDALTFFGISVNKYTILSFVYAGIMASIAGLLLCCRIESGNPNAGNGMEFNSVAAALLGGTSLREGRGGVEGTLFGVLLIQMLKSGLMQIGISSIYHNALIGMVVLVAIVMDTLAKKRNGV